MRFLLLAVLSLLLPIEILQSQSGQIVGKIVDGATGQGIVNAGIQVVGTSTGTLSGIDGRYRVKVPAGTTTLQVRIIGYSPKTVTGIMVTENQTIEQDISMVSANIQLSAVSVTATKEKGTINDALNQQKNSTNVVNAITAEQIARSPDGDAAQAAQRISGVTVQDGKYIQVRGLSERYTTASLNGVRMASPEPERKVVPLDLFPSSLLQDISTSKTFTPDQPGDFAGANVNIRTKEFPARRQVNYSMSIGSNSRVFNRDLPFAPRAGGELVGVVNSTRDIPSELSNVSFLSNTTQQQFNTAIRQQRNVWYPTYRSGALNGSFGASTGGNQIFGKRIGYVLSGNYGYSEETRADEQYAVGNQGANNTVVPLTTINGATGRVGVQWGGIANFSTREPLNISSSFQLASVSKPFTALSIMILKERKLLDYDDKVSRIIDDFPYPDITIRHLLSHTSGLQNYMYLVDHYWDNDSILNNQKMLKTIIYIAVGGAIGSVLRYLTSVLVNKYWSNHFPLATLIANVLGCFLMGFLIGILEKNNLAHSNLKWFLITGFCGGYTTFCTFGYENYSLFQSNNSLIAFAYIGLSILFGLMAVWLGLFISK